LVFVTTTSFVQRSFNITKAVLSTSISSVGKGIAKGLSVLVTSTVSRFAPLVVILTAVVTTIASILTSLHPFIGAVVYTFIVRPKDAIINVIHNRTAIITKANNLFIVGPRVQILKVFAGSQNTGRVMVNTLIVESRQKILWLTRATVSIGTITKQTVTTVKDNIISLYRNING